MLARDATRRKRNAERDVRDLYFQLVPVARPPAPPPPSGITATHVAVGGVAVAAMAGAIYFFTRKKRNRRPRGAKRSVSKAAA